MACHQNFYNYSILKCMFKICCILPALYLKSKSTFSLVLRVKTAFWMSKVMYWLLLNLICIIHTQNGLNLRHPPFCVLYNIVFENKFLIFLKYGNIMCPSFFMCRVRIKQTNGLMKNCENVIHHFCADFIVISKRIPKFITLLKPKMK